MGVGGAVGRNVDAWPNPAAVKLTPAFQGRNICSSNAGPWASSALTRVGACILSPFDRLWSSTVARRKVV